jgi:hypothetical protein
MQKQIQHIFTSFFEKYLVLCFQSRINYSVALSPEVKRQTVFRLVHNAESYSVVANSSFIVKVVDRTVSHI